MITRISPDEGTRKKTGILDNKTASQHEIIGTDDQIWGARDMSIQHRSQIYWIFTFV